MDSKDQYIVDSLQKQIDLITGFIVLQSIVLSYQLGNPAFSSKVKSTPDILIYILILHFIILLTATIIIILQGRKIKQHMGNEISSALRPISGIIIRCFLVLAYGSIPILAAARILQT